MKNCEKIYGYISNILAKNYEILRHCLLTISGYLENFEHLAFRSWCTDCGQIWAECSGGRLLLKSEMKNAFLQKLDFWRFVEILWTWHIFDRALRFNVGWLDHRPRSYHENVGYVRETSDLIENQSSIGNVRECSGTTSIYCDCSSTCSRRTVDVL